MTTSWLSVILATFNGAPYLEQQLASLAGQTVLPTELVVGDDGSYDDTRRLLDTFAEDSPFPVRFLPSLGQPAGACANFGRLLQEVDADYILLCDQDDIWLPDKIACTLEKIRELEARHGSTIPCLVHTDLTLIDAAGRQLAPSFWRYQHLDPRLSRNLNTVLAQNVVTGCTVIINRAARDAVVPWPADGPLMHDWWLVASVLAVGGAVEYIDRPTAHYRQHGTNTVGAQAWGMAGIMRKMCDVEEVRKQIRGTWEQAAALLQRYGTRLSAADRELVETYAALATCGPWTRRLKMWRYGVHKSGWQRTLGLYLYS